MFSMLEVLSGSIQVSHKNCKALGVTGEKRCRIKILRSTDPGNQSQSCPQQYFQKWGATAPKCFVRQGPLMLSKDQEWGIFISPRNASFIICSCDKWSVTCSETLCPKRANVHNDVTVQVLMVKQLLTMTWDKKQCQKTVGVDVKNNTSITFMC